MIRIFCGSLVALMLTAAAWSAPNPDEAWAKEAGMGGVQEVRLGKLALTKGATADVKQFGQKMVTDHSKANGELKGLAAKKKVALPKPDAKMDAEYKKLEGMSGAAFDKEYVRMMVEDHKKDVAAFEKESKSGGDPDFKSWAGKTLPTLKQHLQHINTLQGKVAK